MSACPECGGSVAETISGSSQKFTCESCGWSIARSWTDPINEDETVYIMGVVPGQTVDRAKLAAVSKVTRCNFIAAKRIIEEGCDEIVACKAVEMRTHRENMRSAGVGFRIEPDFPY